MGDTSINYSYGGPAFPIVYRDESKPGVISQEIHVGMQLRDYFAAAALEGMHARDTFDLGLATPEQRASLAYIDADAMLKARALETP